MVLGREPGNGNNHHDAGQNLAHQGTVQAEAAVAYEWRPGDVTLELYEVRPNKLRRGAEKAN